MKIALECLGFSQDKIDVLVVQLVRLIKDNQEFKMSKRAGTSVTLEDLLDVSDPDNIRFMMLTRDANTKFDFDIDNANKKDMNNPVYSIQYAHSRATTLLNKNSEIKIDQKNNYDSKTKKLVLALDAFPNLIKTIVQTKKIQLLANYLINLANLFNSFYSNTKILNTKDEKSLLAVVKATKTVLKLGLSLAGVSAPDKM